MDIKMMFDQIKDYHKMLGYCYNNASDKKRIKGVRHGGLALQMEVAELINSFPWKPWRKIEDQNWYTDNAIEEIVDCLFFLGLIMEAANISPIEIQKEFKIKLQENYNRIKRGYNNDPDERG